ncbi:LA_2272 family surface repeat-containing protein [Sphingobacterium paucimobilis]|uniref:DUF5723 domain-containing protein n=1 Tax=Sphingobacterium paucimobilis HER1398 TaxID=1346330 RepID=U2HX67_9SPHI|nr:hypothetical protein [Sphingobacterium paucimobilis]ERJ59870.1 hypothetical protein M472_13950 [Sphingobacterium paucimobilis HER1398]
MNKLFLSALLTFFTCCSLAFSQESITVKKRAIGTFHTSNTEYNGLSFGFGSTMADSRNVKTNGVRLEVPGIGIISFMGNGFPNATEPFDLSDFKYSEVINGVNLSTGSWCDCNYNGWTIAAVGQYGKLGKGLSLAGGWNIIDKQNGVQLSIIANSSYYMSGVQISAFNFIHSGTGLQIGLLNRSRNFKGMQLGLWNVNQKRSLPIINWNFD